MYDRTFIQNVEQFIDYVGNKSFSVRFQKKDGEMRDMNARLYDPEYPEKNDLSAIDTTKDYIRVFDEDNKGWRTIKIQSLFTVSVNR